MGGMVLETNMSEILTHIEAQNKLEKSEVSAHQFVVPHMQTRCKLGGHKERLIG